MTLLGIELGWSAALLILVVLAAVVAVGLRAVVRRRRMQRVMRQTRAAVRRMRPEQQ